MAREEDPTIELMENESVTTKSTVYKINILSKDVITTVTKNREMVVEWITGVMAKNRGGAPLIVGFHATTGVPTKKKKGGLNITLATIHLCVNTDCLIYRISKVDFKDIPVDALGGFLEYSGHYLVGENIYHSLNLLHIFYGFGQGAQNNAKELSALFPVKTAHFDREDGITEVPGNINDMANQVFGRRVKMPVPDNHNWDFLKLKSTNVLYACVKAHLPWALAKQVPTEMIVGVNVAGEGENVAAASGGEISTAAAGAGGENTGGKGKGKVTDE